MLETKKKKKRIVMEHIKRAMAKNILFCIIYTHLISCEIYLASYYDFQSETFRLADNVKGTGLSLCALTYNYH